MRDLLTLYTSPPPHNVSGLVTLNTFFQEQVTPGLIYDCSLAWSPHNDWGNWRPTTHHQPICPKEPGPDERLGTPPRKMTKGTPPRKMTKKNYQRHAKPPYSYLAMIALVIQNSPDKMLKLSQIVKNIEILFPFFNRDYKGWKDSVRHNLSSNHCFRKVLKDPGKPQAKGNFWTVDVTQIPLDAMKLQNTVMARGGPASFVHDLSPYILHNNVHGADDEAYQPVPSSNFLPSTSPHMAEDSHQSNLAGKLNTTFTIQSLLHNLQDVELADVSKSMESRRTNSLPTSENIWPANPLPHTHNSNLPLLQRSSSPSLSAPQSLSSSSCASLSAPQSLSSSSCAGLSIISPCSSNEDPGQCGMIPGTSYQKRPREDDLPSSSSSDSDAEMSSTLEPAPKVPFLASDLPTSYTKCIPPNAVAPPNVLPFYPLHQFGYYGSPSYVSPAYWGLLPQAVTGRPEPPCPPCPPAPSLDLDSMLRAVPPNKSIFDVLTSHPGDVVHPAFFSQYLAGSGAPCPGQRLV